MKNLVYPKCPYCHKEYKPKSFFNNELQSLFGQYCSDTTDIKCDCGKVYYVSKQTRFVPRKIK